MNSYESVAINRPEDKGARTWFPIWRVKEGRTERALWIECGNEGRGRR